MILLCGPINLGLGLFSFESRDCKKNAETEGTKLKTQVVREEEAASSTWIIYLAKNGRLSEAIDAYRHRCQSGHAHDYEVLQQLALYLLEEGARSRDPETVLLSLFGAGLTLHERALPIFEEGVTSAAPQVQLVALNFLGNFQDTRADDLIYKALSSNFLLIRLEAAYLLAKKKHPKAVYQIESLMYKLDPSLKPLFAQLFALHGSDQAIGLLKRMMCDDDEKVRLAAILSAAKYQRDDLLPNIRRQATHLDIVQQEVCASALGVLKDESAASRLDTLASSSNTCVSLAARQALHALGRDQGRKDIEAMAKKGNLFAIAILGEMAGSEEVLASLLQSKDLQVSSNAAIALLHRQDPRCVLKLIDVLIKDCRDIALVNITSPGKGLKAWKVVPSAQENLAADLLTLELSTENREELLRQAVLLPEPAFIALACTVFDTKQYSLVPTVVRLLEQQGSLAVRTVLKKYQQQVGEPLIRYYCNLALYRLREPGPYEENLKLWIAQQKQVGLIHFRPSLPWEARQKAGSFQLTPEDTSQLLIESYESLAQSQEEAAIEALLEAIKSGHEKNRYALAGLLFRAVL